MALTAPEVEGLPREARTGALRKSGRTRKARLKSKTEEKAIEMLETVERMNYGVSFSPIDGTYTPTEATYNLVLVMDVPMFNASKVPWKSCLPGPDGKCINMDMCELLTPNTVAANRSVEQNQTCLLLDKFVSHLQKTRSSVARDLLARLKAYLELSADYVNEEPSNRGKRDISYDRVNTQTTDMTNESSDGPNTNKELKTPSFMPCHKTNNLAHHLTCLAHSLSFQVMQEGETIRNSVRRIRKSGQTQADTSESIPIDLINDVIEEMEAVENQAYEVASLLKEMETPHLYQRYKKRHKRALLNIGGKLLNSLFGLVTEEEAADMQHALNSLSNNQFKIAGQLKTFEKRVVAVANLTNVHIKRMNNLMRRVDTKFSELFQDVHEGLMSTARFAAFTSSMILTLMQDVERVGREIDQFLVGLRALQRRELSIDLVSEETLRDALQDLQEHIIREYVTFSVAELHPAYYYKYGKPTYSWEEDKLIVYLTVPLKSTNNAFRLYQVTGYSIPATTNSTLSTRPVLENDVFGISHDKVNFLEMKKKDLESCTMSKTIRCELATVVRDVYHRSCLLALFENDKDGIQELCKYRLESTKQEINLQPVSPGRVLVSNAVTVSVQCPGRPAVIRPGCKSCMWLQNCGCSLSATDGAAKSISISPTLQGCRDEQWEQKVEYPVNMPALSRLASANQLANVSHDAYAESLDKIPVVQIRVHPEAQDMHLHENYAFSMDLDDAVEELKQDSILTPLNLVDPFPDHNTDAWMKYLPASLGLSLALSLLLTLLYFAHKKGWLKFKVHKPKPNHDTNQIEEIDPENNADEGGGSPYFTKMRQTVAEILHEYASEARQTGSLPATLQPQSPEPTAPMNIYPDLHNVQDQVLQTVRL